MGKKMKPVLIDELKETAAFFYNFLEELGCSAEQLTFGRTLTLAIDINQQADFVIDGSGQVTGKNQAMLFYGAVKAFALAQTKMPEAMDYQALVKERCLMIDIGRKFYSLAELKALIRSMALFQFTHLQLHFSENEGFRIESERHPEILSVDYLRKEEIRELICYGQRHFIEIIPDFDTPGHLRQILNQYPKWRLPKMTDAGLETDPNALDILNPEAVEFIQSLYEEYGELFCESCYFHIGADEFIDFNQLQQYPTLADYAAQRYGQSASGIEVFIEYVNQTIAFVQQLGFQVRVWNDGFYRLNRQEQLTLSKDCQISYWTRWDSNMAPVHTFFDLGYQVINHNDNFFYYVLGEAAGYTYPTYEKISQGFTMTTFASHQLVNEDDLQQTPAVALSVWADRPEAKTGIEVIKDVFWLQAALSRKVFDEAEVVKTVYQPLFELWKGSLEE